MKRTFVLVLLFLAACSGKQERLRFPAAPVILISIDTLRSDHLPAYGYSRIETPNIDALRRDSILFRRAYSPCPMTLPSHVSMLTGLLPFEHGVRDNTGFRFDAASHVTLPALLRKQGYHAGAAVSSFILRRETGLADDFDFYDDTIDVRPGARFTDYQRDGNVTEAIAERWIAQQGRSPFFFFFHVYEPHAPYEPSYDGEIVKADAIVGKLLSALRKSGVYDRAVIILTSDHGEGLGDHGEQQHSVLLYRESIQVPLILKLPQQRSANTSVDATAQLIDLVPTVTSLLGIEPGGGTRGAMLTDLRGTRAAYSETLYPRLHFGWSDLRSTIDSRHHLIEASTRTELYDLGKDPGERTDVAPTNRDVLFAMKKELERFPRRDAVPAPAGAEEMAKLAALGYIGAARERDNGTTNPRDAIGRLEEMRSALLLPPEQSVAALRRLAAAAPRMVEVWMELANRLSSMGRLAEASDAYRNALQRSQTPNADALLGLADVTLRLGDVGAAEDAAKLASNVAPREANLLLARAALARGDLDRSAALVGSAAGNDPFPSDLVLLADIAVRRGALQQAMELLGRAERRASQNGMTKVERLDAVRADALARMGRVDEATAAYERSVFDFPGDLRAWSNLAVLYFARGDRAASERTLERMLAANPTPAAREVMKKTRAALRQ